jgi:hypothetical protein
MLIALTVPEVRRLLLAFILTQHVNTDQAIAWSVFRRRRQWQAKRSHYKKRGATWP